MIVPNIWENKHVPNHQPDILSILNLQSLESQSHTHELPQLHTQAGDIPSYLTYIPMLFQKKHSILDTNILWNPPC